MRTVIAAVAAIVVVGLAIHGPGRAAVDATIGTREAMELLVFEHPDCNYCKVFRSRVAPRYAQSPQATAVPMRFVDVTGTDTDTLALREPITMVPTAVVMKNGREVDRIAGYWGTDNFFKLVASIIGKAE